MDKKDKWEVAYEDGLTRISEQELGHETFMKGQNAFYDGDYKTAIKEWSSIAKNGHPIAQYNLGQEYYFGENVERDIDLGVYWLKKAAKQRVPHSEYLLGMACLKGMVIDMSYEDGVSYVDRARHQGHKNAKDAWKELNLGLFNSKTTEERIIFDKEFEELKKNNLSK
jgi:TPR repeat protein